MGTPGVADIIFAQPNIKLKLKLHFHYHQETLVSIGGSYCV